MIAYIQLEDNDAHYELPFDLNHRTYNHFKPGDEVRIDEKEILRIIDIINNSIMPAVPEYDCSLVFENDQDSTTLYPISHKTKYYYPLSEPQTKRTAESYATSTALAGANICEIMLRQRAQLSSIKVPKGKINRSIVPIKIYMKNFGKALDNCSISMWLETESPEFHYSNEQRNFFSDLHIKSPHELWIDSEDNTFASKIFPFTCNPGTEPLVGEVFLRIQPWITEVKIGWKVTARQLQQPCEGELTVSVEPEFEIEDVSSSAKTGEEIEELIEDITD